MQEALLSEFGNPFDEINFIVHSYQVGTLDCEVFEEPVPAGYRQSYDASADPVDALYGDLGSTTTKSVVTTTTSKRVHTSVTSPTPCSRLK